ncbi:MAG: fluoride efflux transporter CrcB [Imperialibacter sp.]|uniref:fluoride efflux transporter CrcB n=1 Tax=Imperialibacter sp. TaxID=2038411 RepID=UPI003A895AAD
MKEVLLVGAGGFAGSAGRYLLTLAGAKWLPMNFPLGTFTANVLGCLVIGVLIGAGVKTEWMTRDIFLLLATGFCGGFTTFSTFSAENINLITTGHYLLAAFYFLSSVILGGLAVLLGMWLTK